MPRDRVPPGAGSAGLPPRAALTSNTTDAGFFRTPAGRWVWLCAGHALGAPSA
jgi:hypothetical protein